MEALFSEWFIMKKQGFVSNRVEISLLTLYASSIASTHALAHPFVTLRKHTPATIMHVAVCPLTLISIHDVRARPDGGRLGLCFILWAYCVHVYYGRLSTKQRCKLRLLSGSI